MVLYLDDLEVAVQDGQQRQEVDPDGVGDDVAAAQPVLAVSKRKKLQTKNL